MDYKVNYEEIDPHTRALAELDNDLLADKQIELSEKAREKANKANALINQLYAVAHEKGSLTKTKEMLKQDYRNQEELIDYYSREADEYVAEAMIAKTEEDRDRLMEEAEIKYGVVAEAIVQIRLIQVFNHLVKYAELLKAEKKRKK